MMKNATAKEKLTVVVIAVVLLVFGIYWFGIKTQDEKYVELSAQLTTLRAKEAELDALKQQNTDTTQQINELKNSIVAIEETFLPKLNNECIQNYILNLFEQSGSPYLKNAEVSSVACDEIYLPDGSVSVDRVVCHRFKVEYAATDGYCVPQYNENPMLHMYDFVDRPYKLDSVIKMGTDAYTYNEGYAGFIDALKKLEELNPDCIKLHSVMMDSDEGFNMLVAEIDFYALSSYNRVSDSDTNLEYVVWNGNNDVKVGHGILGEPLYVDDVNCAWYGYSYGGDLTSLNDRPFATYYSIGLFNYLVNNQGLFVIDPEMDEATITDIIANNTVIPVIPTISSMEPADVEVLIGSLVEAEEDAEAGVAEEGEQAENAQ